MEKRQEAIEENCFLELPLDVQERVLNSLTNLPDLWRVGLTCKQLYQTVQASSWPRVRAVCLHNAIAQQELAWVCAHCPNITELDACRCNTLTAGDLAPLKDFALQVLLLSECPNLYAVAPYHHRYWSRNLRRLDVRLTACRVDDNFLQSIGHDAPFLHDLALSYTGEEWAHRAPQPALQSLLLVDCPRLGHIEIYKESRRLVVKDCPKLESTSIHLHNPRRWPPTGGDDCRLEELDLSYTSINSESLVQVAECCPFLRSLNISHCTRVGERVFTALSESRAVKNGRLHTLRLAALAQIKSGSLYMLLQAITRFWRPGEHLRLDISGWSKFCDISGALYYGSHSLLACGTKVPGSRVSIEELSMRECRGIQGSSLCNLAVAGHFAHLLVLDVSHSDRIISRSCGGKAAMAMWSSLVEAAGSHLQVLKADGLLLSNQQLGQLAAFKQLEELSIVGCKGFSDAGLLALASGCTGHLKVLTIGGANTAWAEDKGLAAFQNLRELSICRRPFMRDAALQATLKQHPKLRALRLLMCCSITDRGLSAVPQSVTNLHCICADSIEGMTLSRLTRLEVLQLKNCGEVKLLGIQAAVLACKFLREIEVPGHIPGCRLQLSDDVTDKLHFKGGAKQRKSDSRQHFPCPTI